MFFKGAEKVAKEVYEKYDRWLACRTQADRLKITFLKTDRKRRVCEDMNFLSDKLPASQPIPNLVLDGSP